MRKKAPKGQKASKGKGFTLFISKIQSLRQKDRGSLIFLVQKEIARSRFFIFGKKFEEE